MELKILNFWDLNSIGIESIITSISLWAATKIDYTESDHKQIGPRNQTTKKLVFQ